MFTVLGASGFIGGHLARSLAAGGHEVLTPERGAAEVFSRPLGHAFYCIGLTADFRSRPFETIEAHVCLLAEILRRSNFLSLTYLSSTRVYSDVSRGATGIPLLVDPSLPSDLYNLSKLTGEALCHATQRSSVRVVRLSNVVGPGASESFIGSLVRGARQGRIHLLSHEDSAKDYVHILDVIDLLASIAVNGRLRQYNVASGSNMRHREWLDLLQDLTGCAIETNPQAPIHTFPSIDIQPVRDEFGFSPRSVADLLPELLNSEPATL